jgi:hypothetical protein
VEGVGSEARWRRPFADPASRPLER